MAPFISNAKRNYIFGGICGVAAKVSVKVRMSTFLYSFVFIERLLIIGKC